MSRFANVHKNYFDDRVERYIYNYYLEHHPIGEKYKKLDSEIAEELSEIGIFDDEIAEELENIDQLYLWNYSGQPIEGNHLLQQVMKCEAGSSDTIGSPEISLDYTELLYKYYQKAKQNFDKKNEREEDEDGLPIIDEEGESQLFLEMLQKQLSGKQFQEELQELQEAQGEVESMMSGLMPGYSSNVVDKLKDPKLIEARAKLIQQVKKNVRLKDILDVLGDFTKDINQRKRRNYHQDVTSIVDIELGNDLKRILPQEFLTMHVPELEDLFLLNYAEEALLQYRKEEKQPGKQGDFVIVFDSSYSMDAQADFKDTKLSVFDVTLAFVMAACKAIGVQDRGAYVYSFNSRLNHQVDYTDKDFLKVFNKLVDKRTDGGTCIQTALLSAMSLHDDCDILLITDGFSFLDEERIQKKKEESGCNVSSVLLVGCELESYQEEYFAPLKDVSDWFLKINMQDATKGFNELSERFI